jgi:hypothetical protein
VTTLSSGFLSVGKKESANQERVALESTKNGAPALAAGLILNHCARLEVEVL